MGTSKFWVQKNSLSKKVLDQKFWIRKSFVFWSKTLFGHEKTLQDPKTLLGSKKKLLGLRKYFAQKCFGGLKNNFGLEIFCLQKFG